MIAPNTIQSDEYAQMLFEACRRMEKRLSNLCFDECGRSRAADNKGEGTMALKHYFNEQALQIAMYALAKTPEQLKNIKHKNI